MKARIQLILKRTSIVVLIVLVCFHCSVGGGGDGSPIVTFTASDRTELSIDFEVALGKNIHEVILYFNTNQPQTPTFQITGPGGINGTMNLGIIYDTDFGNPNSGILFSVSEPTAGSGNYELHIYAKPVGVPVQGTFDGTGVDAWNFTVSSLAVGSDPSGQIESWDNSGTQLFEIPGGTYDIANLANVE
jgi:hypothetical protein